MCRVLQELLKNKSEAEEHKELKIWEGHETYQKLLSFKAVNDISCIQHQTAWQMQSNKKGKKSWNVRRMEGPNLGIWEFQCLIQKIEQSFDD